MEVLDISPESVGHFDVVLFLGVLYHMRHPLLAMEKVASVTDELVIVETHVDMLHTRRPAMALYPGHDLGFDPTNWWGPNPEAVVAMVRDVGFADARVVSRDSTPYRAARMGRRALRELRLRAAPPRAPARAHHAGPRRRARHAVRRSPRPDRQSRDAQRDGASFTRAVA